MSDFIDFIGKPIIKEMTLLLRDDCNFAFHEEQSGQNRHSLQFGLHLLEAYGHILCQIGVILD